MHTASVGAVAEGPVATARALAPLVRAHADEADRRARAHPDVIRAMASAGLYRLAAPAVYGGGEVDPVTMIEAIEAVAEADGGAGWCLMIGVETVGLGSAALAPEVAAGLLGARPDVVFSGSVNPLGRARPVEGGWVVNGRWPYASGCDAADFFWGGCSLLDDTGAVRRTPKGHPIARQLLVPRTSYAVEEAWDVAGLRGSGSHDVVVDAVFVPQAMATDLYGAGMQVDGALFRMPVYSRLAYNKVGVATGIARAAIDAFCALAAAKRPFTASSLLCERPQAQLAVAEAEARLRSARAFVFDAVGEMWDVVCRGDDPDERLRALVRLACSRCCTECIAVVDLLHLQAGITANFRSSPLERAVRDVRAVAQHTMVSPAVFEVAGRVLLGLEPGTFAF